MIYCKKDSILQRGEVKLNKRKRTMLREALSHLERASDIISSVSEEEQDDYQNLPESFQEGERGALMEDAIDYMNDAVELIRETKDQLALAI